VAPHVAVDMRTQPCVSLWSKHVFYLLSCDVTQPCSHYVRMQVKGAVTATVRSEHCPALLWDVDCIQLALD
jgi:hypothetical protein